jgi:leucyl aminopeptidase (aminopeptidase T)/DNA-directed RNA polymerase specialized sigma subunit
MGKGNDPNCTATAPGAVRRGAARSLRSQFSGFSTEEKRNNFARALLERAGVKSGEICIIELDGAGSEIAEAQDAIAVAAIEMGVDAKIFAPDHTLSDDEFRRKQYLRELAATGAVPQITLGSFAAGEALGEMEAHEDHFSSEEARQALVSKSMGLLAQASADGTIRKSWSMWPTKEWAETVYPGLPAEEAQARLADVLARATFAGDPEGRDAHLAELEAVAQDLNDFEVSEIEIINPPQTDGPHADHPLNRGTNLVLQMSDEQKFMTCEVDSAEGAEMGLNNPSDEVFGTPSLTGTTGHITTTRPIVLKGFEGEDVIVDGVYAEFEDGKMTRIEAFNPEHQELIEATFDSETMNDMISEVGLVSADGALANERYNGQPVVYNQVVCDENTGVHIGVGSSYAALTGGKTLAQGGDISDPAGHNPGQAHRDFVVGGRNTSVRVRNKNGDEKTVIDGGSWSKKASAKETAESSTSESSEKEKATASKTSSPQAEKVTASSSESSTSESSISSPRGFSARTSFKRTSPPSVKKIERPEEVLRDSESKGSGSAPKRKRLGREERIAQLQAIHAENPEMSNAQIAERMGVSSARVSTLRREAGIPGRRGRPKGSGREDVAAADAKPRRKRLGREERIAQLREIHAENPEMSNAEIAERMGVSAMRVSQLRREAGVAPGKRGRPKGSSNKNVSQKEDNQEVSAPAEGRKRKRMKKEERIAQLQAIHAKNPGMSNAELATMMGISAVRVSQLRSEAGIAPGKRGRPKGPSNKNASQAKKKSKRDLTLIDQFDLSISDKEVADQTGFPVGTVRMRRSELKRREAQKKQAQANIEKSRQADEAGFCREIALISGVRCKRKALANSDYCRYHQSKTILI